MSNRYELLYIIPTSLTEEEAGGVEAKVNALLAKYGATVESSKRLGKYKLAYPIKNERHGYYTLTLLNSEGASVAKIEEGLRISNGVLRHLIVRAEEAGDQKFDLVQFAEVVVEGKDERARRKEKEQKEGAKEEEKEKKDEGGEAPKPKLSDAEVEQKIESALSEDVQSV
jgi:small subunit ribosomal protein S6